MKIQESAENYLETILILQQRNGQVRSIDIVNEMNFKKSSISIAMKHFRENGYICMDEDGYITLTESGLAIAEHIYERHRTLTKYFMALGVSEKNAKKMPVRSNMISAKKALIKFENICQNYNNNIRDGVFKKQGLYNMGCL